MTYYDEKLKALQEKISRSRQLTSMLKELRGQKRHHRCPCSGLEAIKMDEQADVDRLEGRSLASFFYNVIGKMDEQLNKEREAYAARSSTMPLPESWRQLTEYPAVQSELSLRGCERVRSSPQEKATVKSEGGARAEEISSWKSATHIWKVRRRNCVKPSPQAIPLEARLRCSETVWIALKAGNQDLLGGGLLADMAKHSHLDRRRELLSAPVAAPPFQN